MIGIKFIPVGIYIGLISNDEFKKESTAKKYFSVLNK